MNLTRFSIKRPIGISMIVLFFVVLGLFSFYRIRVELLPALNTPYISVFVRYPGANAESVEQQVIKPIEDALSSLSNVKTMNSSARYESGRVGLELEFDADADQAAIDATKKVESIRYQLPDEAEEPVVIKHDENDQPIVEIAVTADMPLSGLYAKVDNQFADVIQQAGGVSEIEVRGGVDREVAVEVDRGRMAAYQLTMNDIVSAIRNENQLLPSGTIYTDTSRSDVRMIAQYKHVADIEKLFVQNTVKQQVPLTAVADIRHQDARTARIGRVNGRAAVNLEIYKNSDANVVETSRNIHEKLAELREKNPDYTFTVVSDDADYVNTALHNTLGTLVEGLCTTGLVLFLFLRGWRSTAAVMVAIPTSLIATFFVMYIAGFTFNMMSLMGMTLCIGILVDDSIVVLENIVRHLQMGEQPEVAAEKGRNEIGMAAIAITLCDAVTFLPIAFMSGMTGQFFRQFGLTIVFAGMFSLFVSFTLTPMLASQLFKKGWQVPKHRLWDFMDNVERWAVVHYERLLRKSFHHQKAVLLSGLGLFAGVLLLVPTGVIGTEYMPRSDEGSFQIVAELPVSRTVEETDKVLKVLEAKLDAVPEVEYYLTRGGGSNAYEGRIKVQLSKRSERSRSIWDVTDELRQFVKNNDFNGANIRIMETQTSVAGVSGGGGPGNGGALRIELRGSDNEKLIAESNRIMEMLKEKGNGISDVSSTYTEGLPELQMSVDREKLRALGVSLGNIDSAMSSVISGRSAGTLVNDPLNENQDTDIKVRFKGADGYKVSDISAIPVSTGDRTVFLGDVADIKYGTGPVTIRRVDKQRAISISANIGARPLNEVIKEVGSDLKNMQLDDTVSYKFKGQATNMNDTYQQLLMALLMAMVLIYMLLAVLYESVLTPFIRMFSLPLGLIGSLLFLLFTGNTLNLYSMIGILVMDGVVAKNGTLLLDYTMTLQERGYSAWNAIIEAGKVRLKPIFMTTLTMIVGMLPTALAMTEGAETRVSMAWVIIGGLITSTIFTLIVIPIIFMFFENYPPHTWGSLFRRKCFSKANIS